MKIFNFFTKFIKNKQEDENIRETINELITDKSDDSPSLKPIEKELLSNILELQELTVEDIMIQRSDIYSIPIKLNNDTVTEALDSSNFTKIPVFCDKLDDIRGFVHIKDLAQLANKKSIAIETIMQKIIFVPVYMPVMDLLTQMRQQQIPIAIVIDEFGGTDGMLTSWDILKKILGETDHHNESDQLEAKIISEDTGSYLADARVPIEELEETLQTSFITNAEKEEIDTIGGLVLFLAGRVPNKTEIIEHSNGYEFEVIESTPRNVEKLRISKKHTTA